MVANVVYTKRHHYRKVVIKAAFPYRHSIVTYLKYLPFEVILSIFHTNLSCRVVITKIA